LQDSEKVCFAYVMQHGFISYIWLTKNDLDESCNVMYDKNFGIYTHLSINAQGKIMQHNVD